MNSNALNLAYTMAIVSIVLFLLGALFDGGMILSFATGALTFVALVVIPVIYIRKERTEQEGFISFKQAFMLSFTGLLIGGIISTIFVVIYTNFIDPEYIERMTLKTMEFTKGLMERGATDEQIETALRDIENRMEDNFSVLGIIKSFAIYAIVYAVLSAVLAAFLKKDKPETAEIL